MLYQLPTAKCDSSGGTMPRFGPYSDDVGLQQTGAPGMAGPTSLLTLITASTEAITDQQLPQEEEQNKNKEH